MQFILSYIKEMELELAVGSTTIKVDVVADDDSLHDIIRSKVTTTEGREVSLYYILYLQ